MKFLSLRNKKRDVRSWAWPSCHQEPKTLSFRAYQNDVVFKTINSSYVVDDAAAIPTFHEEDADPIETVIRSLNSDRLFFEPKDTSSILDAAKLEPAAAAASSPFDGISSSSSSFPLKDTVVLSMDSRNPYVDFRKSIEEMVETHGVNDWERLEELLSCYLKVNVKSNHGYIVAAFVDLFATNSSAAASTTSSSTSLISPNSSPLSFYSSMPSSCGTPCGYRLEQIKEEITREDYASCSSSKHPKY